MSILSWVGGVEGWDNLLETVVGRGGMGRGAVGGWSKKVIKTGQ